MSYLLTFAGFWIYTLSATLNLKPSFIIFFKKNHPDDIIIGVQEKQIDIILIPSSSKPKGEWYIINIHSQHIEKIAECKVKPSKP